MTSVTGEAMSASASDAAPADSGEQTPGALLQQERKQRGLSVQQAAEELHLDPWIVEAIEDNRFLALGAPVYAKGYLRRYALLLGLAPDVVVARYDALSDTPVEPTPVPLITTTPPSRPQWPKYVAWAAMASVVLVIGFVAFDKFARPQATDDSVAKSLAASETSASMQTSAPDSQQSEIQDRTAETSPPEDEIVAPPFVESALVEAPEETTSTQPAAGSVRLRLAFRDSSWVEVQDATGRRLVYEIGQPGRARVVSGVAPLAVVIGVVSAVSLEVNDKAIVIPRRANRDSARFAIAADGSVR